MSFSAKHQSSQYKEGKRSLVKSMTIYPFHLRNSINLTFNINALIKDKEEALKPLDDLEDINEEAKANHQVIIISERPCDSYDDILNDNINALQKAMYNYYQE